MVKIGLRRPRTCAADVIESASSRMTILNDGHDEPLKREKKVIQQTSDKSSNKKKVRS